MTMRHRVVFSLKDVFSVFFEAVLEPLPCAFAKTQNVCKCTCLLSQLKLNIHLGCRVISFVSREEEKLKKAVFFTFPLKAKRTLRILPILTIIRQLKFVLTGAMEFQITAAEITCITGICCAIQFFSLCFFSFFLLHFI